VTTSSDRLVELIRGDALDLLSQWRQSGRWPDEFDLVVTDPPYALTGHGGEHELTATVAVALREAAQLLKPGRWMLVMCAASWRSTAYMVEALRGVLTPVRIGTWCKPAARTRTRTGGWAWASVNVMVFRSGKRSAAGLPSPAVDHITEPPLTCGRRAQLPPRVADWLVAPYAVADGMLLDPFAGSGEILRAAARAGMDAVGIELAP
jgi:DNA modification methylase